MDALYPSSATLLTLSRYLPGGTVADIMMDQRASSYGTGDDDLSSVLINQNNNISASTHKPIEREYNKDHPNIDLPT